MWMMDLEIIPVRILFAQTVNDQERDWNDFLSWFKTAPFGVDPIGGYSAKLRKEDIPGEEIKNRIDRIIKLFSERPEAAEIFFDRTFAKASGDPSRDGFNSTPSNILMDAVKGLKPGAALDAGMGQGRNAVYLAQEGWKVTGFDLSQEAITAACFNAKMAGVQIATEKDSYDTFHFGTNKWDLIVLTFAWAPMEDPAFTRKLKDSLCPKGRIVFEHYIDNPDRPQPKAVHALQPNQLRSIFSDFKIERYEETHRMGDWGGHGEHLVRMVAQKP
jgi:2-polyprenyl-3-methyl-5-hydroxy-6-metoxy-1,4-benzoquinol methylase